MPRLFIDGGKVFFVPPIWAGIEEASVGRHWSSLEVNDKKKVLNLEMYYNIIKIFVLGEIVFFFFFRNGSLCISHGH